MGGWRVRGSRKKRFLFRPRLPFFFLFHIPRGRSNPSREWKSCPEKKKWIQFKKICSSDNADPLPALFLLPLFSFRGQSLYFFLNDHWAALSHYSSRVTVEYFGLFIKLLHSSSNFLLSKEDETSVTQRRYVTSVTEKQETNFFIII